MLSEVHCYLSCLPRLVKQSQKVQNKMQVVCYKKGEESLVFCSLSLFHVKRQREKKRNLMFLLMLFLPRRNFFFFFNFIYFLWNNFHYQDTLKVYSPYLAEKNLLTKVSPWGFWLKRVFVFESRQSID